MAFEHDRSIAWNSPNISMKSLTEQPAVLSVHEGTAGQYILRVNDLKHRPLIIGITKLLSDAQSFVVITPSDIKVFAVDGVPDESHENKQVDLEEENQETLDELPQPEEPVVTPRRRGRPPKSEQAGHDENCQRCAGTGRTKVILDGGAGSETACPICRGEGVMRRYGARR
jgi:hypothetical protein